MTTEAPPDKQSTAALSVASNSGLILLKLVAGTLTGSVAVLTEVVHSSIDLVASIVCRWGSRWVDSVAEVDRGRHRHGKGHEPVAVVPIETEDHRCHEADHGGDRPRDPRELDLPVLMIAGVRHGRSMPRGSARASSRLRNLQQSRIATAHLGPVRPQSVLASAVPTTSKEDQVTKAEFIDQVADRAGLSKKDASEAVDAVLETIEGALKRGSDVVFSGFGKFSVSQRSAREGRNPATGEKIQIAASRVPKFTAGASLKKAVN